MSLQFPIPQFTGQAVRYQGTSWVWDGVAWHIDREASRLDLALIPAYLAQLVYAVPAGSPTFISLSDRDLYGATYTLATREPFEGIKAYLDGLLLVMDDGTGTLGDFQINRAANRIDFLIPLAEDQIVHFGVVTPPDMLAPGRVDIWPIQDLDFDWVTTPGTPIPGHVDGVRRNFDLTVLVPGGDQEFAVVGRPEELAVFIGGIRQQAGVDYVSLSSMMTMTVAPQPGVSFWAMWYRPAGAGAGGTIDAPQPPLDTQLLTYNWVPGAGTEWVDARGFALTVANAADRTGLRNNIDVRAGKLVLQADTDELWRNTAPGWRRYLDAGLMGAVAAGGRMQQLRSTVAAQRPANGSGLAGQFWVNLTDGVIGWFDAAGNAVTLTVPPDLTAQVNARLPLAGGTMTGFITLHAAPTALLHAASKGYVDDIDTAIRAAFLAADNAVRSSFAAADTAIRSEFAAADNVVRGEFAAADTAIRNDFTAADTAIRTAFAAADTAIRNDFTAADAALQTDVNTRLSRSGGTMTGRLVTSAGVAATAPLRIPEGIAPTAPVNGDVWTTAAGVFARLNGATVNLTDQRAFATTAEARAGVATDRVMSPALVWALSGEIEAENTTNPTVFNMNGIPAEATEIDVFWFFVAIGAAAFNVSLRLLNINVGYTSQQVVTTAAGEVSSIHNPTSGFIVNGVAGSSLTGVVSMRRRNSRWFADGRLRNGGAGGAVPNISLSGHSDNLVSPATSVRLTGSGNFTGGSAGCRWRI